MAGECRGKLNHEIIGAYVLYPGRVEASFDYQPFLSEENIGAIPLLPGKDGGSALTSFIDKIRGRKTPESHLADDIPTRGTTVVVAPSEAAYLAPDVVYGTYRNSGGFNQLDWIAENRLYNMPLDKAAEIGIVDEASAKAKSMLFLVSGAQGHKEKPSVFRIKRGSATRVTQAYLVSHHGYSASKSGPEKEYWLWVLEGE